MPYTTNPLLTASQAAAMLGLRPRTLERWRRDRKGPPFLRLNRGPGVRYRPELVTAWLALKEHGVEFKAA